MKLKLAEFFIYLLQTRPFYGRLVSSLERVAVSGLGTMAVGIRDGRAVFFYDPEFIGAISLEAAAMALEHEMLHLVLDHIPRYLEQLAVCRTDIERQKAGKCANIAMDCAINTMLRDNAGFEKIEQFLRDRIKEANPDAPDSPKNGMCLPEKYGLPLEGSFELYQWSLMQQVQVVQGAGGSDHSRWVDGDGEDGKPGQEGFPGAGGSFKDMSPEELLSQAARIREQVKDTLRQVVKSIGGIGRGTLPGGAEEFLSAYIAPAIIPWWEVFGTRAKTSRAAKARRTVAVPNRMLLALAEEDARIIPTPGRTKDKTWRVFVYEDTSGSMSTESLEILKSELHHMLAVDDNMEIRYMQGDCTTQFDVVLRTGDEVPSAVMGRGGTDFTEYFQYMAKYVKDDDTRPDIVVVYTDGYAPAVAIESRLPLEIPVIWLVTPNHAEGFNEGYGEVIVCEDAHNKRYGA